MSHHEGHQGEDPYDIDPRQVLAQYTVEWATLRTSYEEVKKRLKEVQDELTRMDQMLRGGKMTEAEHIAKYRSYWQESTEMVQVKREVEARLDEIQREIRSANRQLKLKEEERLRREKLELEKSNAMIEWMGLKQGFDLLMEHRDQINGEMDQLELRRRSKKVSDDEYRAEHVKHLRQLAELRGLEAEVKKRLSELLEIVRG